MKNPKPKPEWVADIKRILTLEGLTYSEIADRTGYGYNYVKQILSGDGTEKAEQAVCAAFGIIWQSSKAEQAVENE